MEQITVWRLRVDDEIDWRFDNCEMVEVWLSEYFDPDQHEIIVTTEMMTRAEYDALPIADF